MEQIGKSKNRNKGIKSSKSEIRMTFKEDEEDLINYLNTKSSVTCFLKDLARIEMEREKRLLESADSNIILEHIKSLLEQKEPQAPVINLTAQIGTIEGLPSSKNDDNNHEDILLDYEGEIDYSDILGDDYTDEDEFDDI